MSRSSAPALDHRRGRLRGKSGVGDSIRPISGVRPLFGPPPMRTGHPGRGRTSSGGGVRRGRHTETGPRRPLPERFEVFEAHPTAHLTEEQRTWKVMKLAAARTLRDPRTATHPGPAASPPTRTRCHDPVALAAEIVALYYALSEWNGNWAAGGLAMSDERAELESVVLVLRHVVVDGAAGRAADSGGSIGRRNAV